MFPTPHDPLRHDPFDDLDRASACDPYRADLDGDPGFRADAPPRPRRLSLVWIGVPLLFVGALMALGLAPDEGDAVAAAGDGGAAVVPFRMLPSNHMVVEAKLNGEGPFRLIFDLGSPVMILSNRAAERSGAIPDDAPRSFLFGTRGEGVIDAMELGDLTAEDLPVVVMDHPALKALSPPIGRPIDGIVGYTFFARYRTTIDYKDNVMTFTPVEFEVRDLLSELPRRMLGPKVAATRVLAPRGLLGVTLDEPTGGVNSRGVPVASVLPGSSAAEAGLRPGDILTALDGRWAATVADVYEAVAKAEGESFTAVVLRDGEEVVVSVKPEPGI